MIWFKHLCSASNGETLSQIEEEFGLEGYARFFKLMEVVASKSDNDNYFAEYSEKKWSTFLRAKPKKLRTFLKCLENLQVILVEHSENIIRIEMPNLCKFKQKDLGRSRPSRVKTASNPPLEKEIEIDKEVEKETEPVIPPQNKFEDEFNKVWESELKVLNGGRNRKQDSLKHWKSARSKLEANDIIKAWRFYKSTFGEEEEKAGGFGYLKNSGVDRLKELLEASTTAPIKSTKTDYEEMWDKVKEDDYVPFGIGKPETTTAKEIIV